MTATLWIALTFWSVTVTGTVVWLLRSSKRPAPEQPEPTPMRKVTVFASPEPGAVAVPVGLAYDALPSPEEFMALLVLLTSSGFSVGAATEACERMREAVVHAELADMHADLRALEVAA